MTIHIRAMHAGDLEAVTMLNGQLGYPSALDDVKARFERLMSDSEHGLYVAHTEDGSIVGWVHVHARHFLESDSFAELGGLVVDASQRRQGIGRALVTIAETWAQSKGYSELRVRTNVSRSASPLFYSAAGFDLLKTQAVYRKPLA